MGTSRTIPTRDVVVFVVAIIVSIAVHIAVLVWSSLSFAARPLPTTQTIAIDMISASDFSQLTAGAQNAPKAAKARPLADKVGERKPVDFGSIVCSGNDKLDAQ